MTLVRFNPYWRFPKNVNRLFNDFWNDALHSDTKSEYCWNPSVDVKEKEKEFVLEFELPGVNKDDVKLSVDNNVLTVSGEKKYEEKEEKDNYFYNERCFGKFERSFNLPENVEKDKVKANYKDGVLSVSIPKAKKPEPKMIEIK